MFKQRYFAVILVVAAVAVGYFVYSSEQPGAKFPFKLGLDLNGGSHLVYKADVSKLSPSEVGISMDALRDVIENRVNLFGVSEPLVQVESGGVGSTIEQKLVVELPGVTDIQKAIELIGKTPLLEFMLVTQKTIEGTTTPQIVLTDTGVTGRLVQRATVDSDPTTRQPYVLLDFNSEGRELFAKVTKEHKGEVLGIFLDGQPISLPVIQEEIRDGKASISGNFTREEALLLKRDLNYGALPVPIELVSTQKVGASLGEGALAGGLKAGIWSFIIIAIFLILWYRLPGLLAVVALGAYTAIMLAIFKIGVSSGFLLVCLISIALAWFVHRGFLVLIPISYLVFMLIPGALSPVTLTAAGIAGFILSVGMAVDANILIFERMKEEFRKGGSVDGVMREGFTRAWTSIRDSNISSLITAFILYFFSNTSVVKGFALIFAVGVLVSMFTAITVTRSFLLAVSHKKHEGFAKFLFNSGFLHNS